MNNDQLRS